MYLQGKDMDREIFIIPPKIYCPDFNKCWILDKGVYGLKDAGRLWFLEIWNKIEDRGGTFVIGDNAFFYYHKNKILHGVGCLYVDDVFGGGTELFMTDIFLPLMTRFKVSKIEKNNFKFFGLAVNQDPRDKNKMISQQKYISELEPVPDTTGYNDTQKVTLLRGISGQLLYSF